ncbi:MAG: NUDIX domain-containing protein [Candidatus Shapirobacteria bacterium]|jgi:ADP-ribose pyrophosphatase YjhB (NUDIX family)
MDWSEFDRGVFLLNVLAIVYNPQTRQILIGLRQNDPYLKELSWCFPGGRPAYENDLEYYLKLEVKKKTNLDIEVKNIIFAKTYPEKREFLSIYYHCEVVGGQEKVGEKFVDLKWTKPSEVQSYFTTSLHPIILNYLKTLD